MARELSDPILLELVKNALDTIVDEMAIALVRTAYSNNLKNAMDMSCALCDADGRLIAQGLTLPLHLGSIPDAMARVRQKFAGRIQPADVFILNDPFEGGTHLPDFYIFKPIFHVHDGGLVGWSASIGHQLDVGGKTPGGNGCDATEIFQEGLRIPPVKLYAAGEPVEAVFELIDRNVRVPRQVLGDVRSQVAACLTGERGYLKLIAQHGADRFRACTTTLLDQAERLARSAITKMPDGTYEFTDWIDDDGIDPDPIALKVALTVAGDRLIADFTGSAGQVRGGINSPLPFTKSAVYATVRHLIGGDPPNNEGYFRPIEVIAPPGSIVNPVMPAAVAARGLTGFRLANALFGALAQIAPDRVFACEVGGDTGVSFGGYDRERRPFVFLEFLFGSWGGRPTRDGVDACSSSVVNFSNNPIEVIESEYPLLIERYGYVPDSGGAGKFRGGLAVVRQYRFLEATGTLQLRTDRRRHLPYGLAGGRPGTPSDNTLNPEGDPRRLPSKCTLEIRQGDVFRHLLAGAGGWGDPLERDPDRVLKDVLEEKLSPEYARREYGVVVDPATARVLLEETAQRRAQLAKNAGRD
ncbi:MAG TPA: hydantoinase B/oxoprolinase family protein [Methylomirabilota bacterium]|jgi:N-methylhydantoinase B|nr:hydantoinase B/oxoprolinase family protein [Methylomirabilota bacterium]